MTKSERMDKHYGFMCAALTGSYAACANPVIEERVRIRLTKTGESAENFHANFALEAADAALAAFEKRWEGEEVSQRKTETVLCKHGIAVSHYICHKCEQSKPFENIYKEV